MEVNIEIILAILIICFFDWTGAETVELFYKIGTTNSEVTVSYFKVADPTITDGPTLLGQYPKTDYLNCQSRIACAFHLQFGQ